MFFSQRSTSWLCVCFAVFGKVGAAAAAAAPAEEFFSACHDVPRHASHQTP